MFEISHEQHAAMGEPIPFVFTDSVRPTGDPHADAEALDRAERDALRVVFYTETLSGVEWERLVGAHPPPKGSGMDYNPDTFVPALIQRCVVGFTRIAAGDTITEHRPLTDDELAEVWQTWPQWARKRLADTLITANLAVPAMGKARRVSSTLNASVALGATAAPSSPTPPTTTG